MKTRRRDWGGTLWGAAVLIALSFSVRADWNPDDAFKIHEAQLPDLSTLGIDVNATDPYQLADDFLCMQSGPITGLHVWGSWLQDAVDDSATFLLAIHDDDPTGTPQPGPVLWSAVFPQGSYVARVYQGQIAEGWLDPPDNYLPPPADTMCWQYNFTVDLAEAFFQEQGRHYWLSVQAQTVGPLFGWKTSLPALRYRHDAVWSQPANPWEPLVYPPPMHPLAPESLDLAFVLDGPPLPVWEKWVNGIPWTPGLVVTGELGDVITIVDRVDGSVPFQIHNDWSASRLQLIDWSATAGTVVTSPGHLELQVSSPPAAPGLLTNIVFIQECTWTNTVFSEQLWVGGILVESRPFEVYKQPAELRIDSSYAIPVRAGQPAVFTLEFGNDGGYENSVMIRNDFPPEAPFLSASPPPDREDAAGLWVEWDVGDLPGGSMGTIQVQVLIDSALEASNDVEIVDWIYNHAGDPVEETRITFHVEAPPLEACCLPDGSCIDVDHATCVAMGGDPQGPGTDCATVECEPIKWAQPPLSADPEEMEFSDYPLCFWGWNSPSVYSFGPGIVGDDWWCTTSEPITDIHWWGSYLEWDLLEPPFYGPSQFHVAIWTDVPAGIDSLFSHPGVAIWETYVTRNQLNERPVGCDWFPAYPAPETCFRYDLLLDEAQWFTQPGDSNIYWLTIAAVYDTPPVSNPWGWKTRRHFFADDAVLITAPSTPMVGTQYVAGQPLGAGWDLAFVLTTHGNVPPVADANGPYVVDEGSEVVLDGSASFDPDGVLVAWDWDLDNNGFYNDATGVVVSNTWYDNGGYPVGLRVTDDFGDTDVDSTLVTVRNVPPELTSLAATSVEEGGYSTLSGSFSDPGTLDSFTLTVDWGDVSILVMYPYGSGTTAFAESHLYLDDNPSATAQDPYTITATLMDDDGGVYVSNVTVTVTNAPPVLTGVSASDAVEGGFSTVSGFIVDPGVLDTFMLTIDWGDGTGVSSNPHVAGSSTFSHSHLYVDDDPTGTPSDTYDIVVSLFDDDEPFGGSTNRPQVSVSNAPPILSGMSVLPSTEGSPSVLSGSLTDPGLLDTFTMHVDWGDGTATQAFVYPAGTSGFTAPHVYDDSGPYSVHVRMVDDDTGEDAASVLFSVPNAPPIADANGPYTGVAGESIQLDGSGSSDPGNDIVLYEWDLDDDWAFDDALGVMPLYAFPTIGMVPVRLRVEDVDGASDTNETLAIIESPEPCPKWLQPPDCRLGVDVASWAANPPSGLTEPRVADDWLCDGRPLVGITWWGSYIGWMDADPDPRIGPPPIMERPYAFRVAWYHDIPAEVGGYSQPGDLIEEREYALADYGAPGRIPGYVVETKECVTELEWFIPGFVEHEFRYTLEFLPGEEFNEKEKTVYWLSVQALYDPASYIPPMWEWGWKTTATNFNWNDDAVISVDPPFWMEMFYPPPGWPVGHPYDGASVNMAFSLLTDVCPGRCKKWDQPPDMRDGMDMLSSRIGSAPGPLRADDFISDGRPITDIHWWGSYIGWQEQNPGGDGVIIGPPPGLERPVAFELSWHLPDSADPCLPGPPLVRRYVDISRCHEVYFGTVTQSWLGVYEHEYQYYVDLLDPHLDDPLPWLEEEGQPYWLNIQAVFDTNWFSGEVHDGWGWKITPVVTGLCDSAFSPDGVTWWHETLPPDHPRGPVPFDLAFELTTTNLPLNARIYLSDMNWYDPMTLVSTGYTGCGVQVLQDSTNLLHAGSWNDLQTNLVPQQVNTWLANRGTGPRRFFRVDLRP